MGLANLFLLLQVEGHVKFFFSDNEHDLLGRPIRNAPAAQSDGVMSTSGPCGGNNPWGANGFSYTEANQDIIMKINYNGGHKSAQNLFHAAWACADGNGNLPQSFLENGAATATNLTNCEVLECPVLPPNVPSTCNAAIGNDHTRGYVFKCPVPAADAGKNCSMSILDQRDWGGCYDLIVAQTTAPPDALGGGATPAPVGQVDQTIIGMYMASSEEYTTEISNTPDGVPCCALSYGSFFVFELDRHMEVISDVKAKCGGKSFVHNSVSVLTKDTLGPVWRTTLNMGVDGNVQKYELSLSNGLLMLSQDDPLVPQFCDFAVTRLSDGKNAGGRPLMSFAVAVLSLLTCYILS